MNFKRIICLFKGHKQMVTSKIEEVPLSKDTSINGYFMSNTYNYSSRFVLNCGVFENTLCFCDICGEVYWDKNLSHKVLTDAKNFPEINEAFNIKKRHLWEETQRKINPMAESLYKQYLIMLKLSYDPEDDNNAQ